jgi:hypothetical protein
LLNDGEARFRVATTADRDSILALRGRCFPGEDAEKMDSRFWEWELLNAPAGPGLTILAEVAGRPAAHVAFLPQTYVIDGTFSVAGMAFDAMTDPELQGRGLFTRLQTFAVREAAGLFRFGAAYQIRPPSLSPMLRSGWASRLRVPVLVRPVSLRKLIAGRATLETRGQVEGSAEELAATAAEFFPPKLIHQHRGPEYFTWRYLESPVWKYDIRARRSHAKVVAYVITRETTLKGFSTLALVDLAWRPGHRRDAAMLVREAVRRTSAQLAAALITTAHPAFPLLLRAGFLPGPHRFRLLLHDLGQTPPLPLRQSRWALMWGDTDHL